MALEDDNALFAALAMIDLRTWRCHAQVVAAIRSATGRNGEGRWVRLSYQSLSDMTGVSRSTLVKLLGPTGPMWKTQWIIERGAVGVGSRPTAWRLRHPREWRDVPWTSHALRNAPGDSAESPVVSPLMKRHKSLA